MEQTFYEFIPSEDGKFEMTETDCKIGDTPVNMGRGYVVQTRKQTLEAGDVYTIQHDQFHRIDASKCVTLLTRHPVSKEKARVVKPWYQEHSCPLSMNMPRREVWGHLKSLLKGLGDVVWLDLVEYLQEANRSTAP
jgi:hypothetical protein